MHRAQSATITIFFQNVSNLKEFLIVIKVKVQTIAIIMHQLIKFRFRSEENNTLVRILETILNVVGRVVLTMVLLRFNELTRTRIQKDHS